jgi:hypothetical protein
VIQDPKVSQDMDLLDKLKLVCVSVRINKHRRHENESDIPDARNFEGTTRNFP